MYKELKFNTKPITGHALRGPLILTQNFSLRSLGMRRKQNMETDFFFSLSLLSSSFAFLASFFYFAGHFGDSKSFGENFKDLRIR